MRARLVLIPIIAAAAFIGGCATASPSAAPTTPAPADNGVAALSATEILDKAKAALKEVGSFHVKGASTEAGEKVEVDLKIADKDAAGTITSSGLTIEMVKVGTDLYLKADDLWKSIIPADKAAVLALIKGKYVKVPTTNAQIGSLADITNTDDMLKADGTFSKGDAKTVNGTPAIGLVDDKDKSVLYISTVDKPLPIKAEETNGGTLEFTEYGATFDIKAPDAAQVVDLSTLIPTG